MKNNKTIVEEYLNKTDWRVSENSNAIYSIGGLEKHMKGEMSKDYWLNTIYPDYVRDSYLKGEIHLHDLNGLSLYCTGYSLRDLLLKGVRGVGNIPTSSPAKHFYSALNQLANVVTVFQNEIMGKRKLCPFTSFPLISGVTFCG